MAKKIVEMIRYRYIHVRLLISLRKELLAFLSQNIPFICQSILVFLTLTWDKISISDQNPLLRQDYASVSSSASFSHKHKLKVGGTIIHFLGVYKHMITFFK